MANDSSNKINKGERSLISLGDFFCLSLHSLAHKIFDLFSDLK